MTLTQDTTLRNSSYTAEEDRRFLMLLTAFQDYLDGQNDYEVLYSEKLGKFLRLTMEKLLWQSEPVSEIESSDHMFKMFMDNICIGLAAPRYASAPDADELEFDEPELDEMRRQMAAYLEKMPDEVLRAYYTGLLNGVTGEQKDKAAAQKWQIEKKRRSQAETRAAMPEQKRGIHEIFDQFTEVRA